jgi:HSP20 family protein
MQLISHNPWELMSGLRRDVDRMLRTDGAGRHEFVPAVDILEEPERYVVRADLPGVDADAIDITVDGGLLTIRGERKAKVQAEGVTLQRAERACGNFERAFRLPETAASEGFEADYRQGVLTVRIPKTKQAQPYRIQVTAN